MKVLVGTTNPGKIEGVKQALMSYYEDVEIAGCEVSSLVNDQPINKETIIGARNRANNSYQYALDKNIEADYYIGIEEGIMEIYGNWYDVNVAVVKDNNDNESIGFGPVLPIPNKYIDEIRSKSFGKLMNRLLDKEDLNIGLGGIYNLTNSTISRIDTTKEAVIMALTQFYSKYWSNDSDLGMVKK